MKLFLSLLLLSLTTVTVAQTALLTEDFDYPAGAFLRDNGWNPHSAASTNPQMVHSSGLSWTTTPYRGGGVGRAAAVVNTGADENRTLSASVDTGTVYAAFLLKTSGVVTTDGSGFFFHFAQYSDPTNPVYTSISTAFRARTYITTGSNDASFRLGLTFNSATVPSNVGVDVTNDLDTSKTYLVVVKYNFVPGADNDEVSMYVFEDGDSITSEPASPTLGPFVGTAADITAIQAIALRQYNADQKVLVDGIVVQQNWDFEASNTSVIESDAIPAIKVYPNPLSGNTLYVERAQQAPLYVRLIDVQGKTLLQTELQDNRLTLDGLAPGLYLLHLEQSGQTSIQKLVIR
jgi:hypothetical protein